MNEIKLKDLMVIDENLSEDLKNKLEALSMLCPELIEQFRYAVSKAYDLGVERGECNIKRLL